MATFSENFKGGKQIQSCPLCFKNADMQKHSFLCKIIQEIIHIKGRYEEIFSLNISEEVAKTVENITKNLEKTTHFSLQQRPTSNRSGVAQTIVSSSLIV